MSASSDGDASLNMLALSCSKCLSGTRCSIWKDMEFVEQRAVKKYLRKKRMGCREPTVTYGVVEWWFCWYKCGTTSSEDEHNYGPLQTLTKPENINKMYNSVLED